jgi:hypothetical protein
MEKIEYRYRFWYRYRPKFMVSDWYRIETKKASLTMFSVFTPEMFVKLTIEAPGRGG